MCTPQQGTEVASWLGCSPRLLAASEVVAAGSEGLGLHRGSTLAVLLTTTVASALTLAVVLAFAPDCCQMRLGQRKEQQEGTDREGSDASWLLPQIKVRQAPKEEMSCRVWD